MDSHYRQQPHPPYGRYSPYPSHQPLLRLSPIPETSPLLPPASIHQNCPHPHLPAKPTSRLLPPLSELESSGPYASPGSFVTMDSDEASSMAINTFPSSPHSPVMSRGHGITSPRRHRASSSASEADSSQTTHDAHEARRRLAHQESEKKRRHAINNASGFASVTPRSIRCSHFLSDLPLPPFVHFPGDAS
jgi:hypothetical protein